MMRSECSQNLNTMYDYYNSLSFDCPEELSDIALIIDHPRFSPFKRKILVNRTSSFTTIFSSSQEWNSIINKLLIFRISNFHVLFFPRFFLFVKLIKSERGPLICEGTWYLIYIILSKRVNPDLRVHYQNYCTVR